MSIPEVHHRSDIHGQSSSDTSLPRSNANGASIGSLGEYELRTSSSGWDTMAISDYGTDEHGSSVLSKLPRSLRVVVDALREFFVANHGLLLIATSQLFFAFMSLGVKLLAGLEEPVPTFELIATRMAITAVCCIAWMHWQGVPNPITGPPGIRHLLALRGVSGFFGLFGVYYSLQYLSLSDATAITFLSPSTIAVAGFLILHEPLRAREVLAGLFALFGVLLIARPEALFGHSSNKDTDTEKGTPAQRLVAVGVALLGVAGATGALITIRHIGTRAHSMHSISYFSIWCVIVACVGSVVLKVPWVLPRDPMWTLGLIGIGIAGFIGQVFLTKGLQKETASRGSIGLYVQIIYSNVLERIFFNGKPSALSVIGTCIIMTSAVYIALSKQTQSPVKPSSPTVDSILPTSSPHHRSSPSGNVPYTALSTDAGTEPDADDPLELKATAGASARSGLADTESSGAAGSTWSPLSPFTPVPAPTASTAKTF